jgi:hypothetical protein
MTEAPFPIPSRPGTHRLPCPTCNKGKRDDALAVTVEADGAAVWICHRCGDRGSTRTGRIEGRGRPAEPTAPARQSLDKTERARRLIGTCDPAQGSLAETYLASRLIELPATAPLLFNAGAWHWPSGSALPCMVAPIVPIDAMDDAPAQAAHLTFIASDGQGKAQVDKARLYLGPKKGGVVKLTPDEEITTGLALTEGIETGLSAIMADLPTWACLDSGNLADFPVLPGVEALTVVADYDQAGIDAAEAVARRWTDAGREVRILLPHEIGADFNDTAREVAHA